MTKEAGQAIIKSFDLTFVLYEEGNYLSFLFGTAALSPILLGAMFGTLVLFNRHIQVAFVGLGCLLNEAINQVLKKIIKEARPDSQIQRAYARSLGVVSGDPTFGDGSTHSKYGMPSAHTQFMMFLAVCIPLILRTQRGFERTIATLIGWVAAVFVAYSRVHMEHHTIKQVVAGAFVGITVGVLWRLVAMRFVERFVVPFCRKSHFITHILGFTSLYDGQSKVNTK